MLSSRIFTVEQTQKQKENERKIMIPGSQTGSKRWCHGEIVANIPIDTRTITLVATHPATCKDVGSVNFPITLEFLAKSIMKTITGPATTPLSTAEKKSALIGFK